jgi:hypothetical protein
MTETRTRMTASEAYAAVSQQDGLLYHIAHARKENSSDDYDGDALKRVSAETASSDISRMREASKLFRDRSIPRG